MKNNSKLKIFISIIAIALLVCATVGISVSAEEAPAPDIISKNVKVNGNFCLMFAVDPETVSGETVTLNIYNADPTTLADEAAIKVATVQTITKNKTDTQLEALDGDGKKDDSVIVFETLGVSAKDIADVWYITTSSGDTVSDVETYSVREYAYERLYEDGTVSANDPNTLAYRQRTFYLKLLEIGAAAQELLINFDSETGAPVAIPEKLANAYTYASIKDGSFTELSASCGFVEIGDTLTLTAKADSGITLWKVDTYSADGTLTETYEVANGTAITVAGNTVVRAGLLYGGVTPGHYYDDYGNELLGFDKLTTADIADAAFRKNTSATGTDTTRGNHEIVLDSELNSNVLHLYKTGTTSSGAAQNATSLLAFELDDIADTNANCFVFEADIKLDTDIASVIYFGLGIKSYEDIAGTTPSGNTSLQTAWTTTASNWYIEKAQASVDYNKWTNICIEVYDFSLDDDESTTGCYQKIFINGEYVYGRSWSTAPKVQDLLCVRLYTKADITAYDLYLDNIFVGAIEKEYIAN